MTSAETDNQILSLFEGAGPVETPTPGAKAWLARDSATDGKPVLIKRVTANVGRGRATGALSLLHPSIVRTRRWLADGSALYVVRDVIRGRNLRQSLAAADSTRQNAEAVRRLLLPILDALTYAHAQSFPHGGISPENILIAEDGTARLSDFGSIDPRAPHHLRVYGGALTPQADITALSKVIASFLPTTGAFASMVVRGRIEGILGRCDTLADLREALNALERLAVAPRPEAPSVPRLAPNSAATSRTSLPTATLRGASSPGNVAPSGALLWKQDNGPPRIAPGGGGVAQLLLSNRGKGVLTVRMIATQHAWLNVRPLDLPLTIPAGGEARVPFVVSAARLAPGEYRSEVYLSASAADSAQGGEVQNLSGGWFRHTAEIRIVVEGGKYR
ncbi:MAG: protein kinase [Cytophagales bacterium]|nr:protein kinase [Armatimonadota bacterium]